MLLLRFIQLVTVLLLLGWLICDIIVPLILNQRYFPLLRSITGWNTREERRVAEARKKDLDLTTAELAAELEIRNRRRSTPEPTDGKEKAAQRN